MTETRQDAAGSGFHTATSGGILRDPGPCGRGQAGAPNREAPSISEITKHKNEEVTLSISDLLAYHSGSMLSVS